LRFVAAALALSVFGGLSLAVALPVDAALRGRIELSWIEHAQAHGHLQAVGFAGLFIVGVAYRLLPAFAGRPLPHPRLIAPSFWLLAGGVLMRAIAQPVADIDAFGVLLAVSGWSELAGIALFALNGVPTLWPAARAVTPFALFLLAGSLWFVLQAALGAWWLTELAADGRTILPADRNGVLLLLQFFGVHLSFIAGVGVRTLPVFFGASPPSPRVALVVFAVVAAGLAMSAVAGTVGALAADRPWLIEDAGLVLLGLGLVGTASLMRWWRRPTRLRPASRQFAILLQQAMVWQTVAGAMLVTLGVLAIADGTTPTWADLDATRHVVGVGVVLSMVVGMAQLVLPEFAGERLVGRQGAWRGIAFAAALSAATGLRAGARLFGEQLPGAWDHWLMAAAGVLALAVVGGLGFLFVRSWRGYRHVLDVAEQRAQDGRRGTVN
jgi:hypothetical protein